MNRPKAQLSDPIESCNQSILSLQNSHIKLEMVKIST